MARIFNTQGLIQVGEFVGTISPGLNVWVRRDKTEKLVSALKQHYIPENDRDFVVVRKEAFDPNRNWIALEDCPKIGTWVFPKYQYKNPDANRRIDVQNAWYEIATPVGNGNYNVDYTYRIYTTSRKAAWNKYKTNHYLSIDIRLQQVVNGSPFTIFSEQGTEIVNNVKEANLGVLIGSYINKPLSYFANNYLMLYETLPGSSGLSGTAGSHRGMDGLYGRQACN